MSTQQQIKIAVIGAGGWGRQHARIFAARPDVYLCAITGRTAERTEARAAEFGTRAYLDIADMLERERPDLVSLCLPNQGHFAATLQVIQAGVPLLVEKPLVFDLAEADTAARRGGAAQPLLRDQLQPPLRPPRPAGPRRDHAGAAGRSGRLRPGDSAARGAATTRTPT